MGLEVEARFRADDAALAALAAADQLGPAVLGAPTTVDEVDRYLDTAAGDLAAARWACRLRTRGGVTKISLKGPPAVAGGAAWLHRRPELEGPATDRPSPDAWPPSEARDRLTSITGGRPLTERFRLLQRRTERAVHVNGEPVGTLTLDAVRIVAGDRDLGRLRIVELEMAAGDPAAESRLAPLADALARFGGLEPEPRTKLEQAVERLAGA